MAKAGRVANWRNTAPEDLSSACVVLNDGAGVSYGIDQFTHRSGSLAAVIELYLKSGGQAGRKVLESVLPVLQRRSTAAVSKLAADERFKKTLRSAAVTSEMKVAQREIAFEIYLRPALEICEARRFVLPLLLAVVYDSVTHGSWERVSAAVGRTGHWPRCPKLSDTSAGCRSREVQDYPQIVFLWTAGNNNFG